jgi:DNA-directed RNA polymerase subunit RPC12/RpoP
MKDLIKRIDEFILNKKSGDSESKWVCHSCGRKFSGLDSAEKAKQNGCPKCDSKDIGPI